MKMVGANYMGGKRNTARVKSKDVVGRTQRRHFGKQRLASALCVAQGKRIHTNTETLSSLPEITLAHARGNVADPGTTSSRRIPRDGLNISTSLGNITAERRKPSKILGALDISDHLSMRAAIDRILQQSNLIGINAEKFSENALVECIQGPATIARLTQTRLTREDSDAVCSETTSKHGTDAPATLSEIVEYKHASFHDPDQNRRYWSPVGSILSQPHTPSRISDTPSQEGTDRLRYMETRMPTGIHAISLTEGNGRDALLDSVYSLPRSSPFTSSPQSSNNSVLDLEVSPLAGTLFGRRPNDRSEDDCMRTKNYHPIPRSCPSSQSFSVPDALICADKAQSTILSFTNWDEDECGAEGSYTTCYDINLAFSSAANDKLRSPFRIVMGSEFTEDDIPNRISINFLSDPHPWETIGRILELEPLRLSASQSSTNNFTANREGLGYVLREGPDACNAHLSDVTFFGTKIDDKSEDDTCIVSTTDPPMLLDVDPEVGNADDCMAADTAESPCVDNSTAPLLNWESSTTDANDFVDVDTVPGTASVQVVHCAKKEDTLFAFPPTTAAGVITPEPDMTFAGPCLFDDSDLEEDE